MKVRARASRYALSQRLARGGGVWCEGGSGTSEFWLLQQPSLVANSENFDY